MLITLLLIGVSHGWAQSDKDSRIVALIIDLPPWGYQENQKAKGFYTDLAKELVRLHSKRRNAQQLEVLIVPYSRAQQYLNQIPNSFTIMTNTSDIGGHAYSAGSLFKLDVIAIPKPGVEINSIKDLNDLNILKVRGTSLAPKVEGQMLMETSNALAQLNMLFKNRADVIIGVPQDYAWAAMEFNCPRKISEFELDPSSCFDRQRQKALLIRQAEVHVWVGISADSSFVNALAETVFNFKLTQEYNLLTAKIEQYR